MTGFDAQEIWDFLKWVISGVFGVIAWIGGRAITKNDEAMKELRKDFTHLDKAQTEQALYNERAFETKETVKQSLDRIHERLDQIFDVILDRQKGH